MTQISGTEQTAGMVIWLTGLSGAGKTTLGRALQEHLASRGCITCVLDGDEIRWGVSADLGFSPEDRAENNRRVAEIAKLISGMGAVVIVALISPRQADRDRARSIIEGARSTFFEVFVDTPLTVCEDRDPKGFYKRARACQIADFTGVHAPYECPACPDIVVYPGKQTVAASVNLVMEFVMPGNAPKRLKG
jgi:adenylyl-sulfate kinase